MKISSYIKDLISNLHKSMHILEFQNEYNPEPGISEDFIGDGGDGMFVFQKSM